MEGEITTGRDVINILKLWNSSNIWDRQYSFLHATVFLEKLTGSQLVSVHYPIHNSPPPGPILSQIDPVHAPTTLLEDPS